MNDDPLYSVLFDIGMFILADAELGNLSKLFLDGQLTERIETYIGPSNNSAIERIAPTKAFVDHHTMNLFHGVDLTDSERVNEIRILLALSDHAVPWYHEVVSHARSPNSVLLPMFTGLRSRYHSSKYDPNR